VVAYGDLAARLAASFGIAADLAWDWWLTCRRT
jgi:hypothetical protein